MGSLPLKPNFEHEHISCEICLKEVSSNTGKVSEVDEYIMYFCGLECYDKWHHQLDDKSNSKQVK